MNFLNLNNGGVKMSAIKQCDCVNEYQDKRYGKGMRVHTPLANLKNGAWRCTVCGKTKS